jgi:hypothetical protein
VKEVRKRRSEQRPGIHIFSMSGCRDVEVTGTRLSGPNLHFGTIYNSTDIRILDTELQNGASGPDVANTSGLVIEAVRGEARRDTNQAMRAEPAPRDKLRGYKSGWRPDPEPPPQWSLKARSFLSSTAVGLAMTKHPMIDVQDSPGAVVRNIRSRGYPSVLRVVRCPDGIIEHIDAELESGQHIPQELMAEFVRALQAKGAPGSKEAVEAAARETGLGRWLAEHGIELPAFALDVLDKGKDWPWLKGLLG